MTYSVHLSYESGNGSYLSVKGRSEWRTKRTAVKHAVAIAGLKTRDGIMRGLVAVEVENQFLDTLKVFKVLP